MLHGFTFGCGQGATKAMITCIENGVLDKKDCCVVNSTTKDIPQSYLDTAIVISDNPDAGCGKERETARGLMAAYIKEHPIDIASKVINYDYVNIIAAAEGASGSGASVVLARYIACTDFSKFTNDTSEPLHIPVIITLITGFETDVRGISNTINYFKDLNGVDLTVRTVSNKSFLENASNLFTAEKMANEEISTAFKVISAADLDNSEQNIDDTDHFKIITNPGLMFVTEIKVDKKIKNSNQLEQMISDAIDYSNSLEFEPSATKVGLYMNLSENTLSHMNTSFPSIKQKLCGTGIIPEFFVHKQYDGNEEYIRIIASGINLPKEEIADLYTRFQNSVSSNTEDDFFSAIAGMETNLANEHVQSSTDEVDDMLNSFTSNVGSLARRNTRRRLATTPINNATATNETVKVQTEQQAVAVNKSNDRSKFAKQAATTKSYNETSEARGGHLIGSPETNAFMGKNNN